MAFRRVRPSTLTLAQRPILHQTRRLSSFHEILNTRLFQKRQFYGDANQNKLYDGTSTTLEQQYVELVAQSNVLASELSAYINTAKAAPATAQGAYSSAFGSVIIGNESTESKTSTAGPNSADSEVEDFPRWTEVHIEPYRPFAALWLRENCQCHSCVNPLTKQRIVDTFWLPKDIHAKSIGKGPADTIEILWSDNHTGVYPTPWLEHHEFTPYRRINPNVLTFRKFKYKNTSNKQHPTVNYEDVMQTGDGLLDWLQQIVDWGYCLVKDVPVDPEATKLLLERIAFIRHTHYGGFWDFTSDLTYKDTAYTSQYLGPHTDNTYFSDPARLQLFHLLSHTEGEGGKTLLVDGFHAAMRMLEEAPINVQALTDFAQPWHASGNEDVSIQPYRHFPVLERDWETSRLLRIRWNNYDRAAKSDWTYHTAALWYKAARHWNAIIHREDQTQKWLQLNPGTALIFDNWRMLHGRSAFTGKRRMCGGYINNDDFVSRYRLLKNGRENTLNELGARVSRLAF